MSSRDDLIRARLNGASERHAGWVDPVGDARADALVELREIDRAQARLGAPFEHLDALTDAQQQVERLETQLAAHQDAEPADQVTIDEHVEPSRSGPQHRPQEQSRDDALDEEEVEDHDEEATHHRHRDRHQSTRDLGRDI